MDSLLIPALNCLYYQFADHLVDAYSRHEDDRYQKLRTLLAVTFFHELVHAWVFLLLGSVSEDSVKMGTSVEHKTPWDNTDELGDGTGESGYFIEGEIFGATLDWKPWFQPIGHNTLVRAPYITQYCKAPHFPSGPWSYLLTSMDSNRHRTRNSFA